MRTDLDSDPTVIAVAADLGVHELWAVGAFWKLWAWAGTHTVAGHAPSVTETWIDRYVGHAGFASAAARHGWLTLLEGGVEIPNFERHNSSTAKGRALAAQRQQDRRSKAVTQPSRSERDASVTRQRGRERDTEQSPSETVGATRPARAPRGPSRADQVADRPVGIPAESWTRWVEHQWARRKPTPGALAQHREKLAALAQQRGTKAATDFIDSSIAANAQGIYAPAYAAALSGQRSLNGNHHRTEGAGEKLARELREAGITCDPSSPRS